MGKATMTDPEKSLHFWDFPLGKRLQKDPRRNSLVVLRERQLEEACAIIQVLVSRGKLVLTDREISKAITDPKELTMWRTLHNGEVTIEEKTDGEG